MGMAEVGLGAPVPTLQPAVHWAYLPPSINSNLIHLSNKEKSCMRDMPIYSLPNRFSGGWLDMIRNSWKYICISWNGHCCSWDHSIKLPKCKGFLFLQAEIHIQTHSASIAPVELPFIEDTFSASTSLRSKILEKV
jgi:hypothetical protein